MAEPTCGACRAALATAEAVAYCGRCEDCAMGIWAGYPAASYPADKSVGMREAFGGGRGLPAPESAAVGRGRGVHRRGRKGRRR